MALWRAAVRSWFFPKSELIVDFMSCTFAPKDGAHR